jgi:hypothetical protein
MIQARAVKYHVRLISMNVGPAQSLTETTTQSHDEQSGYRLYENWTKKILLLSKTHTYWSLSSQISSKEHGQGRQQYTAALETVEHLLCHFNTGSAQDMLQERTLCGLNLTFQVLPDSFVVRKCCTDKDICW